MLNYLHNKISYSFELYRIIITRRRRLNKYEAERLWRKYDDIIF